MKFLRHIPNIIVYFSLNVFSVYGSALPLFHIHNANVVKNNEAHHPHISLPSSRQLYSALTSLLGFTTLHQFEMDEEESDCNLWVDMEPDDQLKSQDEYDDDILLQNDDDMDNVDTNDKKNGVQWWKKTKDIFSHSLIPESQESTDVDQMTKDCDEHPMRTDEWLIKVKLSPFCILPRNFHREASLFPQSILGSGRKKNKARIKEQIMKFSKNGFVVLLEKHVKEDNIVDGDGNNYTSAEHGHGEKILTVGKWHMDVNGISWTMQTHLPGRNNKCGKAINAINFNNDSDESSLIHDYDSLPETICLYYHADIHLSKFQSKPRMFKGTIVRDRFCSGGRIFVRNLFRPVVASFTAEGIGEDTLALSYKQRGFGLNNKGI